MTFAQHRRLVETSDETINKFMGIFFGFFRSSQIWGNLISALVLSKNGTSSADYDANFSSYSSHQGVGMLSSNNGSSSGEGDRFHFASDSYPGDKHFTSSYLLMSAGRNASEVLCGVGTCLLNRTTADGIYSNPELGSTSSPAVIPESTKYMLLITCLGCGLMGIVIVVALVDHVNVGKRNADPEFSLTSWELCLSTLKMLKDSKCCLLIPLVLFMGLEQGFMFSDFTKVSRDEGVIGWPWMG